MNKEFENLLYQSGLTAQGCWDQMDDYDRAAIEKFAELIVRECMVHASDMTKERVDETVKCGHDWVEMQCPCGHKMYVKHIGREWVGLTDDDYEELLETKDWGGSLIHAVEAKLKEKNCG